MANTKAKKAAMLKALENRLGIVTRAAKDAGIDRGTHYDWLRNDPQYKRAVDALEDVALDFAEEQLFSQMRDGTPASTIFFLKYRGRKRGYVDRKEITGADGEPLIKHVDPSKLSTDAIREILNAHDNDDDK